MYAGLRYDDAHAAIEFLTKSFGLVAGARRLTRADHSVLPASPSTTG